MKYGGDMMFYFELLTYLCIKFKSYSTMKTYTKAAFKKLVFLASFTILTSVTHAQTPVWKQLDTIPNVVSYDILKTDSIGNLYVFSKFYGGKIILEDTAIYNDSPESTSGLIMKKSPNGDLIWAHSIVPLSDSGMSQDIYPQNFELSPNGNIIFTFSTSEKVPVKFERLIDSIEFFSFEYIAKITKSGVPAWIRSFQAPNANDMKITGISIDSNEDIFVYGYFYGEEIMYQDSVVSDSEYVEKAFVAKLSRKGEIQRLKVIDYTPQSKNINGHIITKGIISNDDIVYIAGEITGNREYYFGADTTDNVLSNTSYSVFIGALDKDLNPLWVRTLSSGYADYCIELISDKRGQAVVVGLFQGSELQIGNKTYTATNADYDYFDLFFARYNNTGDVTASTSIGIDRFVNEGIPTNEILVETNSSYNGDIYLISEFEYTSIFSSTEFMLESSDYISSFAAKLSASDFSPAWTEKIHGNENNDAFLDAAYIDDFGNMAISSSSYGEFFYGSDSLTPAANDYFYGARIKNNGLLDYAFAQEVGGNNNLYPKAVATDDFGNTYFSGYYTIYDAFTNPPLDFGSNRYFLGRYARTYNISGSVYNQAQELINNGVVRLYGYAYRQRSTISDTVKISKSGTYAFYDMPVGKYMLHVTPLGDAETKYSPTYYPFSEQWEKATHILVNDKASLLGLDIILNDIPVFEGKGQVEGSVFVVDTTDILKSTKERLGRPSSKATVILVGNTKTKSTKTDWEVIAVTETNEDGEFAFIGIEDGDYIVQVDVPGLPSDYYEVTVADGAFISSIDFLIEEGKVTKLNDDPVSDEKHMYDQNEINSIVVYPIPASNQLNILSKDYGKAFLTIYNIQGAILLSAELSQGINNIDISAIPSGSYIMKVTSNSGVISRKLIVE